MPRQARKKSASGIYHIMMRGINRQTIFEDEEDYQRFIETIDRYKETCGYEIYAYCLMGNHVHLLLRVGHEPLEQVMRRICGSYVYWYNWKYQRTGNLFQGRFKSETVEEDAYFMVVLRYIHQNPLKAGMVSRNEHYKWSSISEYITRPKIVDTDFPLALFSQDREKAVKSLIDFCNMANDDKCLDMEETFVITDEEARCIIMVLCNIQNATELQKMDRGRRNQYLKELKEVHGLSIRQIERVTGINRGVILKA